MYLKKSIAAKFTAFLVSLVLFSTTSVLSQEDKTKENGFVFGVQPGFTLQGAYVGYKAGDFVPLIGVNYYGIGIEAEQDTNTVSTSVNLLNPYVGAKYFLIDKGPLRGYVTAVFSKPLLSSKMSTNGQENEAFSEQVEKLSLWEVHGGFGGEYFFNKHFSISGEFGIRYLRTNFENDDSFNVNITGNLTWTYNTVGLNFYF